MNVERTLALAKPLDAEQLWKQLAAVLPKLVRFYAQQKHSNGKSALPLVRGPSNVRDETCRRYECSEHAINAHTDLVTVVSEGQAHRSVVLGIVQRTVSHGLSLLELWTASGSIAELSLKCDDGVADEVTDLIRVALRRSA